MFKRRTPPIATLPTLQEVQRQIAKNEPVPVTLKREVYLHEIYAVTAQITDVTPGEPGFDKYRLDLIKLVVSLRQKAEKINYNYLTIGEQKTLTDLLTKKLTDMKSHVVLDAADLDWSDIFDWCEWDLQECTQELLKIADAQDNRKRVQAVTITLGDHWQDTPIDATDDEAGRVTFPAFTCPDETIQGAYDKLRESWAQAGLKDLAVEDAYTVNAIASDYLPDSIRIYQRLAGRSDLAAEQGGQLLLGQLQLLQQQVDAVLAKETADALSEMRAHSRFLAGKAPAAENI